MADAARRPVPTQPPAKTAANSRLSYPSMDVLSDSLSIDAECLVIGCPRRVWRLARMRGSVVAELPRVSRQVGAAYVPASCVSTGFGAEV